MDDLLALLDKRGVKEVDHALERSKEEAIAAGNFHRVKIIRDKQLRIQKLLLTYGENA